MLFLAANVEPKCTVSSVSSNGKVLAKRNFIFFPFVSKHKEFFYSIFFFNFLVSNRYPKMSELDVAEICPFCRRNCNCSVCLHTSGFIEVCISYISSFSYMSSLVL